MLRAVRPGKDRWLTMCRGFAAPYPADDLKPSVDASTLATAMTPRLSGEGGASASHR
jgi:hypothetical protein